MLIGYACVSKADGSQSLDLQRDALRHLRVRVLPRTRDHSRDALQVRRALHKAVRAVFCEAALIQRCQVHKLRNILDHLSERQRPWVQAIVRRGGGGPLNGR